MPDIVLTPIDLESPAAASSCAEDRLRRRQLDRHRFMLTTSVVVITLSLALTVGESGHVQSELLPGVPFPMMCGSRALLGVECPGCGLTRSFVSLASGDLHASLAYHRLGWLLAAAVVAQLPYRLYLLWELRHKTPERRWPVWFGRVLIFLLIANWLVGQALAAIA